MGLVGGVGSGLVGLHLKYTLTGSCLLSLGIGQPWEGQSLGSAKSGCQSVRIQII